MPLIRICPIDRTASLSDVARVATVGSVLDGPLHAHKIDGVLIQGFSIPAFENRLFDLAIWTSGSIPHRIARRISVADK